MTDLGRLTHRRNLLDKARFAFIRIWGGNAMLGRLNRNRVTHDCLHTVNMKIVSAGLERVICEGCGHLSFRYRAELSGKIDRSRFVRHVDRLATAG